MEVDTRPWYVRIAESSCVTHRANLDSPIRVFTGRVIDTGIPGAPTSCVPPSTLAPLAPRPHPQLPAAAPLPGWQPREGAARRVAALLAGPPDKNPKRRKNGPPTGALAAPPATSSACGREPGLGCQNRTTSAPPPSTSRCFPTPRPPAPPSCGAAPPSTVAARPTLGTAPRFTFTALTAVEANAQHPTAAFPPPDRDRPLPWPLAIVAAAAPPPPAALRLDPSPLAVFAAPPEPMPPGPIGNNCQAASRAPLRLLPPSFSVRGHEEQPRELSRRASSLEHAPPLPLRLLPAASSHQRKGQKGARHSAAHGPWACALDLMPDAPLTGAARARAGLADVTQSRAAERAILSERAARCLVAVLPLEAAMWILKASAERISARPAALVAEDLVSNLRCHNKGSLEGAYSALGRLLAWVAANSTSTTVDGIDVTDWARATSPSTSTWASLAWVRDHCGLVTHARSSAAAPFRGAPPSSTREKKAVTPFIVAGLDWLAANHPCPFTRGHAAGWALASRSALRIEQASSCVINSITACADGHSSSDVVFGSVLLDKNPDPSKMTARPFLGDAGPPGRGRESLLEMLDGREEVRAILIDTDSPSGDPSRGASVWLRAPLAPGSRAEASLHALLQLPPISLSPEQAMAYKGHASKRHLLCLAEASPLFSAEESNELGRFSGSIAQSPDLIPSAAMLQRHAARCAVLPAIYAGPVKLRTLAALLVRARSVAVATLGDVLADGYQDGESAFDRARALGARPQSLLGAPPTLLLGAPPALLLGAPRPYLALTQ